MLQLIFRKWWVVLIQGILLILLSLYIFNNPVAVLAGISLWFGILVLAGGLVGIIAWLVADKAEKENMSLLWSVVTLAFGLLMLRNVLVTMITISALFGLWMLITGLWLTQSGWKLKDKYPLGWVMVFVGVLSIVAGIMMIFKVGVGAIGISTLLGLQVLFAGIALVILSFAKKSIMGRVRNNYADFKVR